MPRNRKGPSFRWTSQRFPHQGEPTEDLSGEHDVNNFVTAWQPSMRTHGHTLADEARNTAYNRRDALSRDAGLRYKPVTFVCAGLMDPLKDLEIQLTVTGQNQANMGAIEESPVTPIVAVESSSSLGDPVSAPIRHTLGSVQTERLTPEPLALYTVDTMSKLERTTDSESCHSCDEVIVFKGRAGNRPGCVPRKINNDVDANSFRLHQLDYELQTIRESIRHRLPTPNHAFDEHDYIPLTSAAGGRGKARQSRRSTDSAEDSPAIDDYIANLNNWKDDESDGEEHTGLGFNNFTILRDLGGTNSDVAPVTASSSDDTDYVAVDRTVAASRQRHLETGDERMARILAKQEEFGLGSDDLLLFDGEVSHDELVEASKPLRHKKKGRPSNPRMSRKKGQYSAATEERADAFDGPAFMDWHRPSVKNVKDGIHLFNISDSELEEAILSAKQKDRAKKAERKKARQALRSEGLLGKKTNPDDLRVKYLKGMSLDDLANELEVFLLGSQEQLILPPFGKVARKTIHSLANRFSIKSQSAGQGNRRYPVLYRSNATVPFDQVMFDRTFRRIGRTWFPRNDVSGTRISKQPQVQDGKSRLGRSLTCQDGDVVGQHAAEISAENKGRAMLEKMGWSKGMALGSDENKGIMVPITHVIKKNKAGLGES
ncbi:hypothetical protein GGS23DRAFT_388788 [Durotheca rogersii]|uniref:uncharacterized protein n=1 Tax=Durotheca rogersii TaxID=419775 RepID=UPI00221E47FB|nr:uncharacterized protein GGS23DRAFT_388788 [Durotheca rogersii]KAI5857278.1 hypothetical protein GGS23DRAFT_388788 [Durotheca rogersii]